MYIALDPTGITGHDLPTGWVVGMNSTEAGLRAAGFDATTYTGNRIVNVDESTAAWNKDAAIGWFWHNGALKRELPLTNAAQVQRDIEIVRDMFTFREAQDFPKLLSREKVDTVLDNGHSWVDDIIHAWIKPWLRLVEKQLREQKAATNPDPTVYAADMAALLLQAETPGMLVFHAAADRSVWRPLRAGTVAWEYDSATRGTKSGTSRTVTYPDGFTVATWSAYAAMQTL